ncbi:MAG TPA: hypothetical protein VHB21_08285 [Minicystis sp.]|nr:hypothetical protein [Minicystis sp.]
MARKGLVAIVLAVGVLAAASVASAGCASTEYLNEGPGSPPDRATGSVPPGDLGVCKRPLTRRPFIVDQKLWDDARPCTARTPPSYIQIGFGTGAGNDVDPDGQQNNLLRTLREGQNENTGNGHLVTFLRALHDYGLKDPRLRDKVARDSARESVCDYTYLLNTMARERGKLETNKCPAMVYDQAARTDVCLFDTSREEALWLTDSWSCVAHTGQVGEAQSCFRLCAYDDYCAKQVPCAAPDVDLLLCAMGVCLPEARAGVY